MFILYNESVIIWPDSTILRHLRLQFCSIGSLKLKKQATKDYTSWWWADPKTKNCFSESCIPNNKYSFISRKTIPV